jgi:hypothetical protein
MDEILVIGFLYQSLWARFKKGQQIRNYYGIFGLSNCQGALKSCKILTITLFDLLKAFTEMKMRSEND